MSAISLQGISKRYPDHVAVERLDLDVQAGEFMVLAARPAAANPPPCA